MCQSGGIQIHHCKIRGDLETRQSVQLPVVEERGVRVSCLSKLNLRGDHIYWLSRSVRVEGLSNVYACSEVLLNLCSKTIKQSVWPGANFL